MFRREGGGENFWLHPLISATLFSRFPTRPILFSPKPCTFLNNTFLNLRLQLALELKKNREKIVKKMKVYLNEFWLGGHVQGFQSSSTHPSTPLVLDRLYSLILLASIQCSMGLFTLYGLTIDFCFLIAWWVALMDKG